jgi:hypothetical protein
MTIKTQSTWTRYLVAASGTAALATSSASAAIIYWNPADQTAGRGQSYSFDIVSGVVTDSGASTATAFRVRNVDSDEIVEIFGTTSKSTFFAVGGNFVVSRLYFNNSISASSDFAHSDFPGFDFRDVVHYSWEAGSGIKTGYVGLRFQISAQTHFAWAQFRYNDGANQITLLDFAYEDVAGAAILAGAGATTVPEPSTAVLLAALAAGGVAAYRRKRHALAA